MKSIISRLEALEAKRPGTLIFEITLDDVNSRRVDFSGLVAMKDDPCFKDGVYCTGFPEWRIVKGNDLSQLDLLLDSIGGVV